MVRGELTGPPKAGIGKSEPFKAFLKKSKGGRQHLPVKPREQEWAGKRGEARRVPERARGTELACEWLASICP